MEPPIRCEPGDSNRSHPVDPRPKSQSMQPNIKNAVRFPYVAALVVALLFDQGLACAQTGALAPFNIGQNISSPNFPDVLTDVAVNSRQQFIDYIVSTNAFNATFRTLQKSVENGRVDEQAGASANAGGSASAAEKAGLTGLVTAALESGALTQTLDQNLFTVRGNAEGLFRFLSGQEVLPQCVNATDMSCDPSPLNNLELTASFAISKSNTQTVIGKNVSGGATLTALLTSDKRQFSSATARYAIINSRDLRSKVYRDAWNAWFNQNRAALMQASSDLLTAENAIFQAIQTEDVNGKALSPGGVSLYDAWRNNANNVLRNVMPRTEPTVTAAFLEQLDHLIAQIRRVRYCCSASRPG